jgi:ribonuclease P protein component
MRVRALQGKTSAARCALTLSTSPDYSYSALPRVARGATRRNSEADVPAQQPQTSKDTRLSGKNGDSWRARSLGCSQAQRPEGSLRVGAIERETMETIRSSQEIGAIFQTGRRVSHPLVLLIVAKTPQRCGPRGRIAFVAGKRLGSAVTRNRAKRVLREAVRRSERPPDSWDLILIARPGTCLATSEQLDDALASVLHRAGLRP